MLLSDFIKKRLLPAVVRGGFVRMLPIVVLPAGPLAAQVSVSTTYFQGSDYHNEGHTRTGTANISLTEAGVNLPFYKDISEDKRHIDVWTAFVNGKYLKINETSRPQMLPTSKVMNLLTGIGHVRTLGSRWTLVGGGGVGLCTDESRFSHLRWQNVLLAAMGTFIYKVNDNLDLGAGLMATNAFDTPIVLPTLYAKWRSRGRYSFDLASTSYDIQASLGLQLSPSVRFSWVAGHRRIGAPVDKEEEKEQYYSFSALTSGFRTEFKIGKHLTLPVEAGYVLRTTAQYRRRRVSSLLHTKEKFSYSSCPYISIALKMGG